MFLNSPCPELQSKIIEDGAKDSKGCSGKQAAASSRIQRSWATAMQCNGRGPHDKLRQDIGKDPHAGKD